MPFAPISVNTKTFNQAGDGKYMLSSVTFGSPANYFTIKGGSLSRDRKLVVSSVSRNLEKDVTVNGDTVRLTGSVQLVISIPSSGFTSTEIDVLTSDISEFLTTATLDRLMAGES